MQNEVIETAHVDGHRLRVEFRWLGDRFGHLISAIEPSGEIRPLLESIEGTADDNWPLSPPLQNLSIETLKGGRRVALLVGMAAASHWSASIEPSTDAAQLIFDLACRHTKQPKCLGSTYQRVSESPPAIQISSNDELLKMPESITIKPCSVLNHGTSRWKFEIQLHSEF